MKPFSYVAPTSLDEAYKVLAQADGPGSVRAIVGGSDLVDQMKQARRTPSVAMDVKHIPEMNRLEWVAGEGLHLGAAVSCTDTGSKATMTLSIGSDTDDTASVVVVGIVNKACTFWIALATRGSI